MAYIKLPRNYNKAWEQLQEDMAFKGLPIDLRPNLGLLLAEVIEEIVARWESYPECDNDRLTRLFSDETRTERPANWDRGILPRSATA